jgi:hypothetical protein
MAYVPGTNVLQIDLLQNLFTRTIENTLYLKRSTAIDDASFDDVCTWLRTGLIDELVGGQANDLTWTAIVGTDLTTATSPVRTLVFSSPVPGLQSGEPLPANCAAAVSFRTAARGRSARGRNYVAGLLESYVTFNVIDSTIIDLYVGSYEHFRTSSDKPAGWDWGVFSRFHAGAPRTAGLFQPITSCISSSPRVDSQRKRTGR